MHVTKWHGQPIWVSPVLLFPFAFLVHFIHGPVNPWTFQKLQSAGHNSTEGLRAWGWSRSWRWQWNLRSGSNEHKWLLEQQLLLCCLPPSTCSRASLISLPISPHAVQPLSFSTILVSWAFWYSNCWSIFSRIISISSSRILSLLACTMWVCSPRLLVPCVCPAEVEGKWKSTLFDHNTNNYIFHCIKGDDLIQG